MVTKCLVKFLRQRVTAKAVTDIQFAMALVPVLLSELVGSVGFFLSRHAAPEASEKPAQRRPSVRVCCVGVRTVKTLLRPA